MLTKRFSKLIPLQWLYSDDESGHLDFHERIGIYEKKDKKTDCLEGNTHRQGVFDNATKRQSDKW